MNVPLVIFVFLFFFLFGYIFYSSMYAAIGSAVDNETETQQFTLFAIIPLMVGMYGSITIINNPDGPLGFWLSVIPFTSPVAMVARIPFGVPGWQIFLSMALLILSSLLMVFIAAKIYRVGILMYGNKATLKELWKWIRPSLVKGRMSDEFANGLLCLKGGDLTEEVRVSGLKPHLFPIYDIFPGEFFREKYVVYVPR